MPPLTSEKELRRMLWNIGYYLRFMKRHASIKEPLEKLLKKFEEFWWTTECDKAFDTLKENLSTAPILIYPNWEIEFCVHVDASSVVLGAILVQPMEENIDYSI
jgi:hypothetical protein